MSLRTSGPLWTLSLVADRLGLPVLGWWPRQVVASEMLRRQMAAILGAWAMSDEHAKITLDHMMYADLHGIDSHGCAMLLHYHRLLRAGTLTMKPQIEVVRDGPTTALLDGGGGLGHVPADMAMKLAIAKCRATGLAAVAVRNSGHFGAAGAYALIAAQSGFIGLVTTDTAEPAVVPTFGVEAKLGTNPIAFAAPSARNEPFVLDMATSTVPLGRLVEAWRTGDALPVGWALDAKGYPVTNPRRAYQQRRLTPLGGHKGYGLAVAMQILATLLPGAMEGVGHFFLALDPQQFRDGFAADIDGLVDDLRATKPLDSLQPVLVAGDPERAAYAERSRSGIPLSRGVVEDLRAVCRACGAPFLLEGK
ncbi:MAG: Ldh family oxidoreductase [Verrucomicrobia bacterium]|nr:Ldh family oxidoreductase [Verrucomicrobiota bacterium]